MSADVLSSTHFLKRDKLYETEKPYSLRFTPPDGTPRANILLERHDINVKDVRGKNLSFDHDGAVVVQLESKLNYHDFDEEDQVQNVFLKEVANLLKNLLRAQHVQIFEHTIRKRHETFPISTGEPYRYNQPTSIAHVDTTVDWTLAMARQLNPDKADKIMKCRVQCVNFWKPLTGPVNDWPLAMCVGNSIDQKKDFEPCDLVYPDYVIENRQVYHSDRQRWLYLSNQMPHECWVFLQSDTQPDSTSIAHSAFPIPDQNPDKTLPRESIEVRSLVYYGGFEDK